MQTGNDHKTLIPLDLHLNIQNNRRTKSKAANGEGDGWEVGKEMQPVVLGKILRHFTPAIHSIAGA